MLLVITVFDDAESIFEFRGEKKIQHVIFSFNH